MRRSRFSEEQVIGVLKEHRTRPSPRAHGLLREIRGHLEEHSGVAVSSDLMTRVTDAVLGEVRDGRTGPWTRSIR